MYTRIQKGLHTIPALSDLETINLPHAVTKNLSYVTIKVANLSGQSSSLANAGDYLVAPELTADGTQLLLRRWWLTGGGMQMNVSWKVFEMDGADGEQVEHGVTALVNFNQDILITNFSEGHTFSIAYIHSRYMGWSGRLESQAILHRAYNNGLNDVLNIESYLNANTDVYWQIVKLPNATIQREYVTIPNAATDHDHNLGAAVVEARTMLLSSFYHSDGAKTHQPRHLKGSRLLSANQIRYFSWDTYAAKACSYVVEFDDFTVQRGINFWNTQNDTITTGNEVYEPWSFENFPLQYDTWSQLNLLSCGYGDLGVRSTAINMDAADMTDDFRFDRGVGGNTVMTYWEVVEIDMTPPPTPPTPPPSPHEGNGRPSIKQYKIFVKTF